MAQVRKIGLDEFRDVYRNHITRDFSPNEVKPYWVIKKSFRRNRYSAYVYEENGQLLGYAAFVWQKEDILLLDYFAVSETQQNRGIGSAFLKGLITVLGASPVKGILFECEVPSDAKDEQDKLIRERRIGFYKRNGVILTNTIIRVFRVNYNVMYLPVKADTGPVCVSLEILNIYRNTIPRLLFRHVVKIIQG